MSKNPYKHSKSSKDDLSGNEHPMDGRLTPSRSNFSSNQSNNAIKRRMTMAVTKSHHREVQEEALSPVKSPTMPRVSISNLLTNFF